MHNFFSKTTQCGNNCINVDVFRSTLLGLSAIPGVTLLAGIVIGTCLGFYVRNYIAEREQNNIANELPARP